MDIQARETGNGNVQSRKSRYVLGSKQGGFPVGASWQPPYQREDFRSLHFNSDSYSSLSANTSLPHRRSQTDRLQPQSPPANVSQAFDMAHSAKALDEQSKYAEAVRAYERACALFHEAIDGSPSYTERLEWSVAVS